MAETGDLIIKIGGDASKFKATIADVENSLKSFKANLGTTGLNIKIEALGFQEAKSNIKGVTDFAEDSLGALKNRIKEIKQERLTIEAYPDSLAPFNIKLKQIQETVKNLEQAGILRNVPQEAAVATNSLQGLTNKLNELRKQRAIIDPDTNARAIVELNQLIEKLEEKLRNLQILGKKVATPEGVLGGFKQITKGSAEAGRSLTSLALIAQDLPFGFIAIQNNLPAVLQTFGQLKTEAEGNKGALKALAGALVGPAGLFLAFSAVTSIVTVAVQKYGSFGAAVSALFGRVNPLNDLIMESAKSLEEYNKNLASNEKTLGQASASVAGQVLRVRTLASAVFDLSKSEEERRRNLSELKKLDKDRFDAFDIEKGKLGDLKIAVDNYTQSILANAVAQKFTDRVATIAEQTEDQKDKLNEYRKELNKLQKDFPNVIKEYNAYQKALENQSRVEEGVILIPNVRVQNFIDITKAIKDQKVVVQDLENQWSEAERTAISYIQKASGFAKIETTPDGKGGGGTGAKSVFAPQIDSQALDEAFNLDKIIANLTKYGNVLIDVNKTEAERKNALRELSEINPEYFNQFKIGKSSVADAKTQLESFIRTLLVQKKAQEDALAAAKLNNQFRENEEKGITAVGDKYRILEGVVSTIPTTMDEVAKSFQNATLNVDKLFKLDFSKFDTSFDFDMLSKGFKIIEEQSRKIKDNMISALSGVQAILQDTFLELLDEGKGNWKAFGDAAVKEIKRITAALVVKALVEGLANLLTAGISGTVKSVVEGLKEIDTESLGEWLEMTPQANFGGIRGNDGVNMSGQVVMTLRGTDLVGAMNRTNTSINRVG
jgi:hypothetical protein